MTWYEKRGGKGRAEKRTKGHSKCWNGMDRLVALDQ